MLEERLLPREDHLHKDVDIGKTHPIYKSFNKASQPKRRKTYNILESLQLYCTQARFQACAGNSFNPPSPNTFLKELYGNPFLPMVVLPWHLHTSMAPSTEPCQKVLVQSQYITADGMDMGTVKGQCQADVSTHLPCSPGKVHKSGGAHVVTLLIIQTSLKPGCRKKGNWN